MFDEKRLESWVRAQVGGLPELTAVEQMRGGQSNPTFLLRFGGEELVLRKQPPGKLLPSAHAVDREFRALSALHPAGIPVPKPLALCEDREVIGTLFYVMERKRGRIFRRNDLPGCSPGERAAIYDAMNETLVRLHAVEPARVGLGEFGKTGSYYERQVSRWGQQYLASKHRELPPMEALMAWLPKNMPGDGDEARICHGDFRLENLMFDEREPKVIAIFDWELSTLGPPLADLGYNLIPWHLPPLPALSGLQGQDLAALGIPTEDEYARRYLSRAGRTDPVTPFHVSFSLFRLAAILEGVLARARAGNAAASDAEEVGKLGALFAQLGWDIAQRGL